MDEKRRRFEALAMPHLDAAYNLARWLTSGGAEADDIVQDAMLRAFRSFDGFRGEAVRPWLLAIVRNCHRSALEQRKRHAATPLGETDDTEIAAEGVRRFNKAIRDAIGLENLLTIINPPTLESAAALFDHKTVRLLVVTGGPAVARAALASKRRANAPSGSGWNGSRCDPVKPR